MITFLPLCELDTNRAIKSISGGHQCWKLKTDATGSCRIILSALYLEMVAAAGRLE